ncbi:L-histidine N(alpha)-methyltransferase [Methylobacterium sp. CM6257]
MTIKPTFPDATPVALETAALAFLDDVREGLSKPQKALSPKYFYDAAGSDLFEAITRLPEYYPTRTEIGILDRSGPGIAALLPAKAALVEFGSGSTAKLRRLLRHLDTLAAYVPVDVSGAFLRAQAEALKADLPQLRVEPVVADFTRDFDLPDSLDGLPRAGFFPGSTIGNFEPAEAEDLLRRFGRILGEGAHMIVGVDLVKDTATLEQAYDDSAGVTAAFNLNLLTRINRELAGRFDLDAFTHRAVFNRQASRIEMHLVARDAHAVRVGSDTFAFAEGETIHTESSYKYTVETFRALAERAGWTWLKVWTDPEGLFSVHALRLD